MAEDVRRRRAERVKQERAKTMLTRNRLPIVGGIVVLALIGTVIAFPGIIPKGPVALKPAHEHPAWMIVIEGQPVSFHDPAYDIAQISGKVHMHYFTHPGDPTAMNTWHVESRFPDGIPDVTMQNILLQYQVHLSQGSLKLDSLDGHNGSTWPDRGNHTWHVFVSSTQKHEGYGQNAPAPVRLNWTEIPGDYAQYIPRNGDKILITYGDLTPDEIARQQALVPDPLP